MFKSNYFEQLNFYFWYVTDSILYLIDSEATEKMTYILNDIFDVLNGPRRKEAIDHDNWITIMKDGRKERGKKETLEVDATLESKSTLETFASTTTLEGLRMLIQSAIDLTEELLNPTDPGEKYDFVLSAKWNQDALEVPLSC